jgi:[ribosomal protein S18]-alanine N-acetyltransferase
MSAELDRRKIFDTIRFRPMTLADVSGVIAVERATYSFPWSDGVFRDCIRVGYLCRVVEAAGEVAGYGIMSHGANEAHLLNICIRSELRGAGIGRKLMDFFIERARSLDMRDIFLEVRPSNPIAIRLYESLGFTRIGVRRGYYQAAAGREDALVYRLALEKPANW